MSRMLQGIGSHLEILVAVLALTLAESQRHSYLSGSLQTRTPKGILSDFTLVRVPEQRDNHCPELWISGMLNS